MKPNPSIPEYQLVTQFLSSLSYKKVVKILFTLDLADVQINAATESCRVSPTDDLFIKLLRRVIKTT